MICARCGNASIAQGRDSQPTIEIVELSKAKRAFVLWLQRWEVQAVPCRRSFGWLSRFRRLARDAERLPETLAGLHFVAFVILLLPRFIV